MTEPGALGPEQPGFWTEERKEEHRRRGEADRLCRLQEWAAAREYCTRFNLSWPPFPKTPMAPGTKEEVLEVRKKGKARGRNGGPAFGNTNNVTGKGHIKITVATPEDTENLIGTIKNAIITGTYTGKAMNAHRLGPITKADREAIQRLAHVSAEEFNQRLSEKLGVLADSLIDSLQKDVDEGKLKPGEKAFPIAISMDKRNALDGRNQVNAANIAIQVNNYAGPKTREELMKILKGQGSGGTPVTEI